MNANFETLSINFVHTTHRNMSVILCKFDYYPQFMQRHQSIKTTEIYAKITTKTISKVQSPLDNL
jgi:hypothetical protein